MFRRVWPILRNRKFASHKVPAFHHEPVHEGMDRFVLSVCDNRKTKSMNEIINYINAPRAFNIKEICAEYREKFKELIETEKLIGDENDEEMKILLKEEVKEISSELNEFEEELWAGIRFFMKIIFVTAILDLTLDLKIIISFTNP